MLPATIIGALINKRKYHHYSVTCWSHKLKKACNYSWIHTTTSSFMRKPAKSSKNRIFKGLFYVLFALIQSSKFAKSISWITYLLFIFFFWNFQGHEKMTRIDLQTLTDEGKNWLKTCNRQFDPENGIFYYTFLKSKMTQIFQLFKFKHLFA